MITSQFFHSIEEETEGLYKEKGSKFIAYAYPVSTVEEVMEKLQDVKSMHPKARHHCYAYRLGRDRQIFRQNDDGEPSGTAGRPILGQIDSFELTNVLVVVVRYFGGKLLGASGLITAYKECTSDALHSARIIKHEVRAHFKISFDYAVMGSLMQNLSKNGAKVEKQVFDENPRIWISMSLPDSRDSMDRVIASTLDMYVEEVQGKRTFDRMSVERFEDR
mgnify:CR=1 FL=1